MITFLAVQRWNNLYWRTGHLSRHSPIVTFSSLLVFLLFLLYFLLNLIRCLSGWVTGGLSLHRLHDVCVSNIGQVVFYSWSHEWRRPSLPFVTTWSLLGARYEVLCRGSYPRSGTHASTVRRVPWPQGNIVDISSHLCITSSHPSITFYIVQFPPFSIHSSRPTYFWMKMVTFESQISDWLAISPKRNLTPLCKFLSLPLSFFLSFSVACHFFAVCLEELFLKKEE